MLDEAREAKRGVIWMVAQPDHAKLFDRVLVFDQGRLVADGTPDSLAQESEVYQTLVS